MKNGVGRQHAGFTPWFWSYRLAAKLEALVVVAVFAGVIAILALLWRMPGPLVVHFQDDKKETIQGARGTCSSLDKKTSDAGSTMGWRRCSCRMGSRAASDWCARSFRERARSPTRGWTALPSRAADR